MSQHISGQSKPGSKPETLGHITLTDHTDREGRKILSVPSDSVVQAAILKMAVAGQLRGNTLKCLEKLNLRDMDEAGFVLRHIQTGSLIGVSDPNGTFTAPFLRLASSIIQTLRDSTSKDDPKWPVSIVLSCPNELIVITRDNHRQPAILRRRTAPPGTIIISPERALIQAATLPSVPMEDPSEELDLAKPKSRPVKKSPSPKKSPAEVLCEPTPDAAMKEVKKATATPKIATKTATQTEAEARRLEAELKWASYREQAANISLIQGQVVTPKSAQKIYDSERRNPNANPTIDSNILSKLEHQLGGFCLLAPLEQMSSCELSPPKARAFVQEIANATNVTIVLIRDGRSTIIHPASISQ